jgi:hypothetical protein
VFRFYFFIFLLSYQVNNVDFLLYFYIAQVAGISGGTKFGLLKHQSLSIFTDFSNVFDSAQGNVLVIDHAFQCKLSILEMKPVNTCILMKLVQICIQYLHVVFGTSNIQVQVPTRYFPLFNHLHV